MALESEIARKSYSGNGVTTSFPFPYYFLDATDLDVYTISSTGVETTKAFVTDYDVIGNFNPLTNANDDFSNGANVVFVTAPASGLTVVIIRNNPDTQDTSFVQNSAFSSSSIEGALDKIVMMVQYLKDRSDRSIRMTDPNNQTFDPRLPNPIVADSTIAVNPAGTAIVMGPTVTAINTSTTAAAASAAAAAVSASAASSSATAAATSATNASTSATNAASSAAAAAASAASIALPLVVGSGGTGVTSVTISPTASSFAGWDASKNLSANNMIEGFTSTATAAGTTTMTITSTKIQVWTGSTTQTVKLPTTSIVAGQQYLIENRSTGVVTVQSSGANTIQAMAANTQLQVTALVATPTTAANWDGVYSPIGTVPITLGGTGQITKAAAFDALQPMTTGGDIIFGGASGTGTRLANGSSGQVLTSAGGTAAPSWAPVTPILSFWTGYHGAPFNWTSSGAGALTNSASGSFTKRQGSLTVTAASSNGAGITFTPSSASAAYWVVAKWSTRLTQNSDIGFKLSDGTTDIDDQPYISNSATIEVEYNCLHAEGVYQATSTSAVTISISCTGGAANSFAVTTGYGNSIEWTLMQIK